MKRRIFFVLIACSLAACGGSKIGDTDAGPDGGDGGTPVQPVECLADPDCDIAFVSAHRGLCGNAPENTLAAFLECELHGVPMIEIDTRETSDGEIVLMHDGDVIRTTDGETRFPGRTDVDQLSLAEFESLVIDDDQCEQEPDSKPDRCHPPSFAEVLDRTSDQTIIMLDFKDGDAAKLGRLVEQSGATARILFFDSNLENLRAYRTAAPGGVVMPRAHDAEEVDTLLGTEADDLDLLWIHGDPSFSAEVEERLSSAGVRLYVNGWDGVDPVDVWIVAAMAAEEAGDEDLRKEYEERAEAALEKMIEDGARAIGSDFGPAYVEMLYPGGFGT